MISLIIVLISISLFAIMLSLGMNSVNLNKIQGKGYEDELRIALPSTGMAIESYHLATGMWPDETNWEINVYPVYGLPPRSSIPGSYQFSDVDNKKFVCFSSSKTDLLEAISESLRNDPGGKFKAGSACGVDGDLSLSETIVISYKI